MENSSVINARIISRAEMDVLAPQLIGSGRPSAFMIVNLLHFRNVNYALSHAVGDILLADADQRIAALLPAGAIAARVGTRYPILLPDTMPDAARAFAHRISAAFERPLQAPAFGCELSVHIGLAYAPQHADSYRGLLRGADVALFQASESGVSISVYDPNHDPHTPERLALLGELRGAIERGELQLYCQPKIDIRTGELTGAESLVRWQHPQHGLLGPASFVPLLETTDLMMLLTETMLKLSAHQVSAWRAEHMDIPLAVNLSSRDVSTLRLSAILPDLLAQAGVSSATLGLEVTESSLMHNPQDSIAELQRLHDQGFELYVDDFGTGFSSLSYLADLPIQVLKIDYSFTSRMLCNKRAASIVRATIGLAHELDLKVVAEGASDLPTWEALAQLGCDQVQGFFVARPFPAAQMSDWLSAAPYKARQAH
jgi:diguanylate cyclase (GGDEF)-like protein